MRSSALKATSYIYLILVPIFATGIGFGIGHVRYQLYLPIWLLNALLMLLASWTVGLHLIQKKEGKAKSSVKAAFLLVAPWIIISLFAGLGPPPETATEWTKTATEQEVRYSLLVVCGVLIAFGFLCLKEEIKGAGETFYSLLGSTVILIAIPLFIINMLYWGFYLTELFRMQAIEGVVNTPEWFLPIRQLFRMVSVTEVALTYLATFAMAVALKKSGWLSHRSSTLYILFSLTAFGIVTAYACFRDALAIPGFLLSIPAFPFLLPYFIGVNLLRKAGNKEEAGKTN